MEDFDSLALAIISEIPYGSVASYSQIAKLMGYPKHARHVGKACARSEYYGRFPCHRVVNAQGRLCPGWDEQPYLLKLEGIELKENGCVDLKKYGWK